MSEYERPLSTGDGLSWLGWWLMLGMFVHSCAISNATFNVPKPLIKEAFGPANPIHDEPND